MDIPINNHNVAHFLSKRLPPQAIKLSIITQFYPPDYAATGQLIEELASYLGQQGLQVRVFTGQPNYAFDQKSAPVTESRVGLEVKRSCTSRLWPYRIRGRAINGLLFCLRAGLKLLNPWDKPDLLLITTEPPYLNLLGLLARCCLGIPYVCLIYDLYPDIAIALNVLSQHHWLVRFWHYLNRLIWLKSDGIIVLNSTMKDRVVARYPEIASKISVIPSWCNSQQIVPLAKTDNWFARQHCLTHKFTVLYSGNMGRCHDMETILLAAQRLQGAPVQFVFTGQGAKQPECVAFAQRWQLDNCIFLPYQDKRTLPYSLTACDLSLISIFPGMEGLVVPSKLYSSLASGRPIAAICETHSYLRDILSDAKCGASFDHSDSEGLANFILSLMERPALAQEMGYSGRRYLEQNYTLKKVAGDYLDLFCRCIDQRKAKAVESSNVEIDEIDSGSQDFRAENVSTNGQNANGQNANGQNTNGYKRVGSEQRVGNLLGNRYAINGHKGSDPHDTANTKDPKHGQGNGHGLIRSEESDHSSGTSKGNTPLTEMVVRQGMPHNRNSDRSDSSHGFPVNSVQSVGRVPKDFASVPVSKPLSEDYHRKA
jgi:glycosyltransferase involved in cell wall biosynthesis